MYTVKQLSDLAGVSVRTLHYYDEIALLKPECYGANGYRFYGDESLLRLQQILFFKELDFSLDEISKIMSNPSFDMIAALRTHKKALQQRQAQLNRLIRTVDQTIQHLEGSTKMDQSDMFEGFTEEQQESYAKEAYQRWGDSVTQSMKKWKAYSKAEQKAIMAEGSAVYLDLVANMDKGHDSPQIMAILARWHQHMRYFYEPTPEILLGLGNGYYDDPAFNANLSKIHPDLPSFLKRAIPLYVESITVRE